MSYRGLSGQSAIEYLMTYGWMLLVVAVVGGAIFATVGNQSVDSTSGFSGSDVQIDNFGVSSEDELGLEMRGASGSEIMVSRVNVSDPGTGKWVYKEFTGENRIGVGSSKVFELPNLSRTGSSNELNVEIVYDSGGLSNLSVSGTVSGSLELTDSGSFEGLPEDDHQSIDDGGGGGSLSLMQTVNYTYDDSGDVQVNESTAGSDGYQVDLNNGFSNEVEEIRIVEMHGADGADSTSDNNPGVGGSGGYITNAKADVSTNSQLSIWVGETPTGSDSGFGRFSGGATYDDSGGGGGSTEIVINDTGELVAAADAGGGANWDYGNKRYGGGGGARGGPGGLGGVGANGDSGDGTGFGGWGGNSTSSEIDGENAGQELGIASLEPSGQTVTGGSSPGSGEIIIEYYG
ncbi:MAG: hypothetical protein R6V35_03625 [Candidatus Nanohaloarchaea archaeon]